MHRMNLFLRPFFRNFFIGCGSLDIFFDDSEESLIHVEQEVTLRHHFLSFLSSTGLQLAGTGLALAGIGLALGGTGLPLAGSGLPLAGNGLPLAGNGLPLAGNG